ncbi:MAG: sodium:proton antiporter, partial [Rhizobacter sp.]|nr:sodium:proton antiporter [Rhizobacter sp.]
MSVPGAASLSIAWGLPFAGVLLSIALLPLTAPSFWHHHQGKVAAAWTLAFLVPFAFAFGPGAAIGGALHALVAEYVPFVLLLTALYVVAGGIFVRGNLHGSAALNTQLLGLGAVLASVMGTTGASMLLIRPLLRANDQRKRSAHVVVFFIFIVANAGGSLTPLGDPPLFLGFLRGVPFFWTLSHLFVPALCLIAALLAIFYVIDRRAWRVDAALPVDPTPDTTTFGFEGRINFALLAVVLLLVLMSGVWKPGLAFSVAGADVSWAGAARDVGLLIVIALSLWLTPQSAREANRFSWAPMAEVAK